MTTLRTLLAAALLSACAAAAGERCPAGFTPGADGRCAPAARDATAEPADTRPARASAWSDAGTPSTWAPPDATEPRSDVGGATTATDAATPDCPWQQRVRLSEVLFDPAGDDAPEEFVGFSGPAGAPLERAPSRRTARQARPTSRSRSRAPSAHAGYGSRAARRSQHALALPAAAERARRHRARRLRRALIDASPTEKAPKAARARLPTSRGPAAMRCGSDDTDDNAADFVAGIPRRARRTRPSTGPATPTRASASRRAPCCSTRCATTRPAQTAPASESLSRSTRAPARRRRASRST